MTIYDVCDLLLEESRRFGVIVLSESPIIESSTADLAIRRKIPPLLFKPACELLRSDGYFINNFGDYTMEITASGRFIRDNGGYKQKVEEIRRQEDRKLQREVQESTIRTNNMLKRATIIQVMGLLATVFMGVSMAIIAYLDYSIHKKEWQLQREELIKIQQPDLQHKFESPPSTPNLTPKTDK